VRHRIANRAGPMHDDGKEAAMRKTLYGIGWIVLFALPLIYGIQIVVSQDLPSVEWWKWAILLATVVLIYSSRNRDDVLKHHVV
jgi:hypothetical protein